MTSNKGSQPSEQEGVSYIFPCFDSHIYHSNYCLGKILETIIEPPSRCQTRGKIPGPGGEGRSRNFLLSIAGKNDAQTSKR